MPTIQQHVSLRAFNTLAIEASARYFCEVRSAEDIPEVLAFAEQRHLPVLILGGGSNIVLTDDYCGLVVHIKLEGIRWELLEPATAGLVRVTAAAGERWHGLVEYCLANKLYGLENLSLIPGSVGAAPIQNIGAYGVELVDVFDSVSGWDIEQQVWRSLNKSECEFAYRDSIFKRQLKHRFIISEVSLILQQTPQPHNHYAALSNELNQRNIQQPTPQQIADVVIAIRQSKLPNPAELPNVGSFFKNPIITAEQAKVLLARYPAMVQYPMAEGRVKLAAGWLLEQAGWKGLRDGSVGMHQQQSLVLVNYHNATGSEVIALAEAIQQDIQQQFSVQLEIEPAIVQNVGPQVVEH
ncbi:MAG: UDP-N-acetylmuramate dehydrogenase [Spongiibacteraceae bacterium]